VRVPRSERHRDTEQNTTAGLAFWRKATNTPTFTNGFDHWALTSTGLVYWTGDSIDPPRTAAAVPAPTATAGSTAPYPLCTSADIDGPATVCLYANGVGEAYRRTPSADVVLASKLPNSSTWTIRRPASGADCGRVDDSLSPQLVIECANLDFSFKLDQILNHP